MTQNILHQLKNHKKTIKQFNIPPNTLTKLITKIKSNNIPNTHNHKIFKIISNTKQTITQTINTLIIIKINPSNLNSLYKKLLTTNPKIITNIQNKKLKTINTLIKQTKKKNPNITPNQMHKTYLQIILNQNQQ